MVSRQLGRSLIRMVSHRMVSYQGQGVSRQGGLISRWSLIRVRVVSHQGGLLSGWSFIMMVFYQGGLSSGWSLIRVVSHHGGLFIRVVSCQCGLSSGWSLIWSSSLLCLCSTRLDLSSADFGPCVALKSSHRQIGLVI